jgi:hypothetical protein
VISWILACGFVGLRNNQTIFFCDLEVEEEGLIAAGVVGEMVVRDL